MAFVTPVVEHCLQRETACLKGISMRVSSLTIRMVHNHMSDAI